MLENRQLTEWDALQSARRQLARAEETQRAETPQAQTQPGANERPLSRTSTVTVETALLGEDALMRASAQQLGQDIIQTLKKVAERKRQVDAMMSQLLHETREIRRRKRQRIASRVVMAAFLIALCCWANGHLFSYWWIFFGGGGALAADERVGKRREAVQALYTAGEPRAVGVLAIALRDGDYTVQRVAEQALRDLLPRVRASDAAYIDREQMNALLALADVDVTNTPAARSAHMQTALLKALEQIGDERAIPAVENLAVNGASTAVRQLASECLPHLAERVRLAQAQSTLLRGSASPALATASEQLLRPASGEPTTPAEQLLRPTQGS
jgi:hypothetical protein